MIFWIHLLAGICIGLVILSMAVSGMILAFEPQMMAFAERGVRNIALPETHSAKLSPESLMAHVRKSRPDAKLAGMTAQSDPAASVALSLGRGDSIFINPYTGEILGSKPWLSRTLLQIEDWHRGFGSWKIGGQVTGAGCAALLFMVLSGFYLWWPRNGNAIKAAIFFNPGLRGNARDWNRHNTIGFWCWPLLLITTVTGLVMAYPWANDLLFKLTGSELPSQVQSKNDILWQKKTGETEAGLDALWANAEKQVSEWKSISMYMPKKPGAPVMVYIQEPANPSFSRSQLTLDAQTAEVRQWAPYANQNSGRRLRAWIRPLHTGQAGGILGQGLAFIAGLGALMLVWSGCAMAWRKFFKIV